MQFERYVLQKFEAVERYLDLVLMGFLLLERERLRDLESAGPSGLHVGAECLHARVTDRLRLLDKLCLKWNAQVIERHLQSNRGRRRLKKLLQRGLAAPRVA